MTIHHPLSSDILHLQSDLCNLHQTISNVNHLWKSQLLALQQILIPEPECQFLDLPYEIITMILAHLSTKDLKNIASTCRTLCMCSLEALLLRRTSKFDQLHQKFNDEEKNVVDIDHLIRNDLQSVTRLYTDKEKIIKILGDMRLLKRREHAIRNARGQFSLLRNILLYFSDVYDGRVLRDLEMFLSSPCTVITLNEAANGDGGPIPGGGAYTHSTLTHTSQLLLNIIVRVLVLDNTRTGKCFELHQRLRLLHEQIYNTLNVRKKYQRRFKACPNLVDKNMLMKYGKSVTSVTENFLEVSRDVFLAL
eukprot:TRINITY_DN8351_c0_g1::TRINITY_DN8351_c0_g1_i1::g.29117::m.29117 TRINITY_DN8351_c0_g1::TRINITY_DN8351_c0_g1_i1::g.29117  ORF type:complete len:307 (-),score=13.20,F-box/PF00646.28/4.8e-07,F-box/PF00646.28/1.1e+03,F-box-like/PF12937.2/6.2e+02,F-box-like/PF12937.2/3.1e-05,PRANC/PF09372.5/0.00058,PRANC/PF09372.5/2.2e+03,PRANC/PF09372.5/1.4e+03 TRINITY_DN8351_c0_g1_i1:718-1638(-)